MVYVLALSSPGFYPQAKHAEAFRFSVYLRIFTVVQEWRDLGMQNFVTNIWIIDNRVNILCWKETSLKTPLRKADFNKVFEVKISANEQWTIWSLKLKWSGVVVVKHAKLQRPSLGSSITWVFLVWWVFSSAKKVVLASYSPNSMYGEQICISNRFIYSWCMLAFPFSVCQGGK